MKITKLSSNAIAIGTLVKMGADADHVAAMGATDPAASITSFPIGVTLTAAGAAEERITIATLAGALTMTAAAAITAGAPLENAASGRVQPQANVVGEHIIVGTAISAAAGAGLPVQVAAGLTVNTL